MKKIMFLFCAVASLFLTSCTIKTTQNNRRTVSVSGTGSVEVEADSATIVLSVITRAKDAGTAARENAEKMTKVQEAVTSLGILKEDVSTDRYSIDQETTYTNGRTIRGDYVATNRIRIFVKELSMTGDVIDAALKNGANQLSSFQYGISGKDSYVKQARTLAVQNAHDAANLLATTSGAFLGKVLSISEETNNFGIYRVSALKANAMMEDSAAETAAVSTPISGGKTTISFTVDVVYELK